VVALEVVEFDALEDVEVLEEHPAGGELGRRQNTWLGGGSRILVRW
jgi:hypothetical protein